MNDKNENYLEELSNIQVGGNSIPSASGLIVIFNLVDGSKRPGEGIEKYEGKSNKKYYWEVYLHELKFHKDAYRVVLEDKKPEKLKYIEEFQVDRECILKLSPTATKQFSQFMLDEKITDLDNIKFLRLGEASDTEYKFKKIIE